MNNIFLFLASSLTLCDLKKVILHVWGLDKMFKGLCDSVPLDVQPVCNLLDRDRVCQCKGHMWKGQRLGIRGLVLFQLCPHQLGELEPVTLLLWIWISVTLSTMVMAIPI